MKDKKGERKLVRIPIPHGFRELIPGEKIKPQHWVLVDGHWERAGNTGSRKKLVGMIYDRRNGTGSVPPCIRVRVPGKEA